MTKSPNQLLLTWINFWVFVFSVSVLAINHYSGLAAITLMFTMIFVYLNKHDYQSKYKLRKNELFFIILVVLFWSLNLTTTLFQPNGLEFANTRMALKSIDNPSRWILMLPIYFLFRRYKLDWKVISIGLSIGVFISVGIAFYEVYFLRYSRAYGGMNLVITFGQLMVAADMLLWVFMIYAWNNKNKTLATFLLISSLVAFYGSLLSVTRGAWLAYLIMILSLFVFAIKRSIFNKQYLFSRPILLRILLAMLVFFIVSQSPQYNVIKVQTVDTVKYVSTQGRSDAWGSEAIRIDIYKTALEIARNYPWGVGTDNFQTGGKAVIILDAINNDGKFIEVRDENDKISIHQNLLDEIHNYQYLESFNKDGSVIFTSRMGHAHNEWLNVLAENGFLGFILFTVLFFFPIYIFWKNLSHKNSIVGMYSYCGILLIFSFAIFGQTQAIFSSHATLIFFIFFLYLFIAQIFRLSR